jgi:hypothetical protein
MYLSLCSDFQPRAISFILGLNIILKTLFSDILNLCSSLSVRNAVSHPYKTTDKIIILYILAFIFLRKVR